MTEDRILRKLPRKHRNLVLGIGDDAAIFRPRAGEDLVFTTDLFIEGVHFAAGASAPEVGRRALARSLSDIAAMGAVPRFCLVSLALPEAVNDRWVAGFYAGLLRLAEETNTALAGGDLAHAKELICDVMVCGAVKRGEALRRHGARPGDFIYVSGPLGGWRHRQEVAPRLDIGKKLTGKATACIDISDGLALDLHRLCEASGVSASLDTVPLLPGATLEQALHDGEDYELLYTAPPRARVPGLRIGVIEQRKGAIVTLAGKKIPRRGYDHFGTRTRSH